MHTLPRPPEAASISPLPGDRRRLALGACGGSDPETSPATTPSPIESVAPDTTSTPADDPDSADVPIEAPVDDTVAGTDPLLAEQWGVTATNVPRAWAVTGGAGVVIAVIDSGVDLDHPDLAERLVADWDFVDGDDRPDESPIVTPIGGTAVVDDGGSGTITVEVSESGVPVSWRCT